MKGKIFYLAWSIYRDIIFSGLNESVTSKEDQKKTIRFNQFIVLALLVNFLCVVTYFYHGLYISALIKITSAYFFLLALYFNARRKQEVGRIISIIKVNLYLIVICYIVGLRAGDYLLFFPYFLLSLLCAETLFPFFSSVTHSPGIAVGKHIAFCSKF